MPSGRPLRGRAAFPKNSPLFAQGKPKKASPLLYSKMLGNRQLLGRVAENFGKAGDGADRSPLQLAVDQLIVCLLYTSHLHGGFRKRLPVSIAAL